nr:cation transporting ATPase C-terminal domain-containing protein [Rhodococcus sp. BS-15]
MTTAVALGLMLAFEPKEPGIMSRLPRRPDEPLLTRALMVRILLVSTVLVVGAWAIFEWEQSRGAGLDEARTVALNMFVAAEIAYLFSCRSLTRSAWQLGLFTNRWIVVGVLIQTAGQIALTYLPAMNALFGTAPIGIDSWLLIGAVTVVLSLVVGIDKRVHNRRTFATRGR